MKRLFSSLGFVLIAGPASAQGDLTPDELMSSVKEDCHALNEVVLDWC